MPAKTTPYKKAVLKAASSSKRASAKRPPAKKSAARKPAAKVADKAPVQPAKSKTVASKTKYKPEPKTKTKEKLTPKTKDKPQAKATTKPQAAVAASKKPAVAASTGNDATKTEATSADRRGATSEGGRVKVAPTAPAAPPAPLLRRTAAMEKKDGKQENKPAAQRTRERSRAAADKFAAQRLAAERELEALRRAEERLKLLKRGGSRGEVIPTAAPTPPPAPKAKSKVAIPAESAASRAADERMAQGLMITAPPAGMAVGQAPIATAPVIEQFAPYRPWSWPGGDPYAVAPLPMGYGENRITAMAVDPYRVHIYIEMTDEAIATARQRLGHGGEWAWFVIRVYDTTDKLFNGSNANDYFDIAIGRATRAYYVALARPNRTFVFEVGLKSHESYFQWVARSNAVTMPADAMAQPSQPHFITVLPRRDRPPRGRYQSRRTVSRQAPPPTPDITPHRIVSLLLRGGLPIAAELRSIDETFWMRAERSVGGGWRLTEVRLAGGDRISPEVMLELLGGDVSLLGLGNVPFLDIAWSAEGPVLFELHEVGNRDGQTRIAAWYLWVRGNDESGRFRGDASRVLRYLLGGYLKMRSARVGSEFAGEREQGVRLMGESGSAAELAGLQIMSESGSGRGLMPSSSGAYW